MAAGLKIYQATNGVLQSPGDAEGTIPTTHIARAAWLGPDGAYHSLWDYGPVRGIDFTLHVLDNVPTIAADISANRDARRRGGETTGDALRVGHQRHPHADAWVGNFGAAAQALRRRQRGKSNPPPPPSTTRHGNTTRAHSAPPPPPPLQPRAPQHPPPPGYQSGVAYGVGHAPLPHSTTLPTPQPRPTPPHPRSDSGDTRAEALEQWANDRPRPSGAQKRRRRRENELRDEAHAHLAAEGAPSQGFPIPLPAAADILQARVDRVLNLSSSPYPAAQGSAHAASAQAPRAIGAPSTQQHSYSAGELSRSRGPSQSRSQFRRSRGPADPVAIMLAAAPPRQRLDGKGRRSAKAAARSAPSSTRAKGKGKGKKGPAPIGAPPTKPKGKK